MKVSIFLTLPLFAIAVSGCGNWNSVYHSHDFSDNNSALIDIKQRAVLSSGRMTCAEPSPDALAAYAGELAAKADVVGKGGAQFSGAYQEVASFVGQRTQTIQLLRDQMFRLCEARMNGVISEDQYQMLLVRNQKFTVMLMSIEQLTGGKSVPVVALTSKSSAELIGDIEADRKSLKEAEDKKKALEAKTPKPEKEIAEQDAVIKALNERIAKGNASIASGETAHYIGSYQASSVSDAVADKIVSLVNKMLDTSDSEHLCFAKLSEFSRPVRRDEVGGDAIAREEVLKYCIDKLREKPIVLVPKGTVAGAGTSAGTGTGTGTGRPDIYLSGKMALSPDKQKELMELLNKTGVEVLEVE